MFKEFWERWNSFRATVDDTTATIRAAFWAVGVVAVITLFIGNWFASLNNIQRNALWVIGGCLIIVVLTYVLDWQRKRGIDKIPELLAKMDSMIFDYYDQDYVMTAPMELIEDLAKLMNFNISELKSAATSGNKNRAEQEFAKFADAHTRRFNSKNYGENLLNLRLAGAIMSEYNVGMIAITNTEEYQKLYQRVRYLRKRLPSATISRSISEYFNQSDGLYSMLFSIQPFANLGAFQKIIPVKIRAYSDIVRPTVEGHTSSLVNGVRESIDNFKHKYTVDKDETNRKTKR
ncbi:MAG: hypothetical protein PHN78_06950 [Dehalococcoidales bacterium]|nr:hypothetical protein [Dehalococcoidales bacterium]